MLSGGPSSSSAIDLSRLPAPTVVEQLSYEAILDAMKATLSEEWPEFDALVESDPAIKILEVAAWYILLHRQQSNEASRANMLAFATGADLDNLAALVGVARLEITPADPAHNAPAVMEDDTALRERVVLAPESFSVAGPTLAYVFHARSAHADVLDASALSPEPGQVLVTVLSRIGDGTPEADVIDAVEARVNSRSVRPLTDQVTVQGATIVPFAIAADLYLFEGPDPEIVLAAAQARIEDYVARAHKLGRDINRSAISAAMFVEGVQRVELAAPAEDVELDATQSGNCTGIALEFAGHAD